MIEHVFTSEHVDVLRACKQSMLTHSFRVCRVIYHITLHSRPFYFITHEFVYCSSISISGTASTTGPSGALKQKVCVCVCVCVRVLVRVRVQLLHCKNDTTNKSIIFNNIENDEI